MVEQFKKKPKDIYISVRLYPNEFSGELLGWFSKEDLIEIGRIENQGFLDNFVMYDDDLLPIDDLFNTVLNHFRKEN